MAILGGIRRFLAAKKTQQSQQPQKAQVSCFVDFGIAVALIAVAVICVKFFIWWIAIIGLGVVVGI
jgi:hypothetical protein